MAYTREFDLVSTNQFGWVRTMRWFRIGLGSFAIVFLAIFTVNLYKQVIAGEFRDTSFVGAGLIFFVLGLMLLLSLALRSPAVRLSLDDAGFRLTYRRGDPYSRKWDDTANDIRGRWTLGIGDTISGGKPRYSLFGRFGGLTETFIPEEAFLELKAQCLAHGLRISERSVKSGWKLYRIEG